MHRDVKPSNTLLSVSAGAAKLADFGLARPLDGGERPNYTHAVATRWYRAPELLYGARAYGPAMDLWALGLVFVELLGEVPNRGHAPSLPPSLELLPFTSMLRLVLEHVLHQ
jgi:serine/threonine protein kinase